MGYFLIPERNDRRSLIPESLFRLSGLSAIIRPNPLFVNKSGNTGGK